MSKTTALVVLSGGLDSTTLAYHLHGLGHPLKAVSFDYGQRHKRELTSAMNVAAKLGIGHRIIDVSFLRELLGSALTDPDIAVPHGHYEEESMRATVVPNRNTIMLSIAWGIACAEQLGLVALGVHAGDHHIYPDCRPGYVADIERALRSGTEGHREPTLSLSTPFIAMDKAAIVARGLMLGVPYELTWTCYEGGARPCGQCGSCRERAEAFEKNSAKDPLV